MIIIISGAIIADDQSVVAIDHSINTANSAALITADSSVVSQNSPAKISLLLPKK